MNFELIIDPLAEEDIEEAFRYFEDLRDGLGTEFLSALSDILDAIEVQPHMYQVVDGEIRRGVMRRFQYAVFYRFVDDRKVLVLAVQHTSRQWRNWRDN